MNAGHTDRTRDPTSMTLLYRTLSIERICFLPKPNSCTYLDSDNGERCQQSINDAKPLFKPCGFHIRKMKTWEST